MLQRFLREREREAASGVPTSNCYRMMDDGLFPRPVRLSERAVAWPETEIAAWQRAKMAGATDADIKALVARLHAARTAPVMEAA